MALLALLFCFVDTPRRQLWIPAWQLWLFRFQVVCVYCFAGIAKLDRDWLLGEPARSWVARWDYVSSPALREAMTGAVSYGGLVFDLSIGWFLLLPRTRKLAMAAACAFHLFNAWHFEIGVFPYLMIGTNLLFMSHRRLAASEAVPLASRLWIGLYVALQLLIPLYSLRNYTDGPWTERNHRWAWRMMLRAKPGSVSFIVTDAQGKRRRIELKEELCLRQSHSLCGNPQRMVQYARHLRDRGALWVSVHSEVRFNGRPAQALLDPLKDASATPLYDLILPLQRGRIPTPNPRPGWLILGFCCLLSSLWESRRPGGWAARLGALALTIWMYSGQPAWIGLALLALAGGWRRAGLSGRVALAWTVLLLLTIGLAQPQLPY